MLPILGIFYLKNWTQKKLFAGEKLCFSVLFEESGSLPYSLVDTFFGCGVGWQTVPEKNHIQYYARRDSS